MAYMILNRIQVVCLLPQQDADGMLKRMEVELRRMHASEHSVSLKDDVHVLSRPPEQPGIRVGLSQFNQGRFIKQGIAIDAEGVQRGAALLETLDRQFAIADIASTYREHLRHSEPMQQSHEHGKVVHSVVTPSDLEQSNEFFTSQVFHCTSMTYAYRVIYSTIVVCMTLYNDILTCVGP